MVMPRQIRGDFSYSDIPEQLQDSGFAGRVSLRFLIDVDGRARDCRAVRSSGSRLMDAAACRALEQRFRFTPGRDETGRPVPIPGELNPYFEAEVPPPEPRERRRGW
jgi:protein TonB